MTFNVSLKKTISCELNNAVAHTLVLSHRTWMLNNWPTLPVAEAMRSQYWAASFLSLPVTAPCFSVVGKAIAQGEDGAPHPAICQGSFLPGLIFASRCPGPSGPHVAAVSARSIPRICRWLTFPLQFSSQDSGSVISVLLQRHPMQQIDSSACSTAIWRVSSWDLYKIMGFEEMSDFYLYFGMRYEHLQAVNPCFAQLLLSVSWKV